uniref:Uncharacterized protein n=1 Tax=Lotharella oceanica TaxID=641309 RepID=A0A7S2TU63_9EUKA|mmetsp:Transcript_27182/g.50747  ORF Transcript_27182/g.50747 Transcript_27182/m.50747 type:complete len:336 (+) Transcript_27182:44-1051(+)
MDRQAFSAVFVCFFILTSCRAPVVSAASSVSNAGEQHTQRGRRRRSTAVTATPPPALSHQRKNNDDEEDDGIKAIFMGDNTDNLRQRMLNRKRRHLDESRVGEAEAAGDNGNDAFDEELTRLMQDEDEQEEKAAWWNRNSSSIVDKYDITLDDGRKGTLDLLTNMVHDKRGRILGRYDERFNTVVDPNSPELSPLGVYHEYFTKVASKTKGDRTQLGDDYYTKRQHQLSMSHPGLNFEPAQFDSSHHLSEDQDSCDDISTTGASMKNDHRKNNNGPEKTVVSRFKKAMVVDDIDIEDAAAAAAAAAAESSRANALLDAARAARSRFVSKKRPKLE